MARKAVKPSAIVPRSAADDRRAILLRAVEADLEGSGLAKWEEQFCKWLAMQHAVKRARQIEVASLLAGTAVTSQELVQLRCRPAWRALWAQHRDVDQALKRAKADYSTLIEESPSHYRKMLGEAVKAKDVRAATPLLTPLLERAVPKHDDGTGSRAPSLHIHLSVGQQKGLEADPLPVTAEEVVVTDYEVVE